MVDSFEDTIIEEREEVMVSFIDEQVKPMFRVGHFLKPTIPTTEKLLPSPPIRPNIQELRNTSLKIQLMYGISYMNGWCMWVEKLKPLYQETWKKSGIFEAIIASTFKIRTHNELIIALAERWCFETNTFVFPWGEATLTLEDMVVLGGFSVLGHCVLDPVKTKDFVEIEKSLRDVPKLHYPVWLKFFSGRSGDHIEHVAFITLWLSRYVHPTKTFRTVDKALLPIAIHLCQGNSMALAPAVLARIYKDLSLLKRLTMSCGKCNEDEYSSSSFAGPLQFVQLWAWERFFPSLKLKPNVISRGEPRMARWHMVKIQKCWDVSSVIDSEAELFLWRPYATKTVKNWELNKFYQDKNEYVVIGPEMASEILIFARFVRASELVGMDCVVEQYQPHRVSMQFGFDQDVPGCVNHASNSTPKTAWTNYNRPIKDAKLYIPSRLFEPDVSRQYIEWWKNQKFATEDAVQHVVEKAKRPKTHERIPRVINASVPCGFVSRCDKVSTFGSVQDCEMRAVESSDDDDNLTIAESLRRRRLMKKDINVPCNQEPLPGTQSRQSSSALNDGTARERETLMGSKPISKKHGTSNGKSEEDGAEPYVVKEMMPQENMDDDDKGSCKLNLPDTLGLASDGPNANKSDGRNAEFSSASPAKMSLEMSKASVEAPKVTVESTNITERKMQMENISTTNHEKGSSLYEKIDNDILKLEMRMRNVENIMAGKVPRIWKK